MIKIDGNHSASEKELEAFLKGVDFKLPESFIDFYKKNNGASIWIDNLFIDIWPIDKLLGLNEKYNVNEYAPEFFIIGSNGGGMAYAIEKKTGYIFEIPFIGMSKEEAVLPSLFKNFRDFIV